MSNIIIKNLTKKFNDKTVLDNVDLTAEEGKITCIMAPSGKGKTTLFRIISGLETASSGSVEGVPAKISYVFQEDRLCEDFKAVSNVRFVIGNRLTDEEIEDCLLSLGLEKDSLKLPVKELSGGMKRRVAIARALLCEYELLILDEPFKGFDEKLKVGVIEYIKKETKGKTVLLVTHDRYEAELLGAEIKGI